VVIIRIQDQANCRDIVQGSATMALLILFCLLGQPESVVKIKSISFDHMPSTGETGFASP
jgi:hypothetical protein